MFRISQEQIKVFELIARANFHWRLAAYLREVMPQETVQYGDDALVNYIVASEARASAHGIETESGIAQWTCLALILGLDFNKAPAVREYFKAPGMGPEEKLEALVDGLNDALFDSREEQG